MKKKKNALLRNWTPEHRNGSCNALANCTTAAIPVCWHKGMILYHFIQFSDLPKLAWHAQIFGKFSAVKCRRRWKNLYISHMIAKWIQHTMKIALTTMTFQHFGGPRDVWLPNWMKWYSITNGGGAAHGIPNRVALVQMLPHRHFLPTTTIPPHPACHPSPQPLPTTTVIKKLPGKYPWLSYHPRLLTTTPFSLFSTTRTTLAAIVSPIARQSWKEQVPGEFPCPIMFDRY